ncbi:hypothetical protein SLW70_03525 [Flavobacterium sp. NG2]|uniref:hypothetical protein n=1 Tax=Flavobacterium sp. NG2 TaxID=3097547 RepID=UPI002A81F106|nr:hypothetical protein [Flavobacterium sp. NG2]WPR72223.1 hypothetical protein SLW70_03525 [Flavobacterium sp. NG2]
MNLKKYKPLLFLFVLTFIAFVVHKLFFVFLSIRDDAFVYSIETLYLLFFGSSVLVFIVMLEVKERSFDNVGMSFLLVTNLKLVFFYILLKPILEVETYENTIEKINFFGMFILFLAIETILTIRILNEKQ